MPLELFVALENSLFSVIRFIFLVFWSLNYSEKKPTQIRILKPVIVPTVPFKIENQPDRNI